MIQQSATTRPESAPCGSSNGEEGRRAPAPPSAHSLLRRLAGGTFHYGIGQSITQVVNFLLIPVFTRYLSPEDYGLFELAGAFAAMLVIFIRLGVPGAVTRFYYDHAEGPELRDYVTTVWRFLLVSSAAVGGGLIAAGWLWPQWSEAVVGLPFHPYFVLVVLTAVLLAGQNLQDRLVQSREQASYMAKLNFFRGLLTIVATLAFIVGLQWAAVGYLLAQLVVTAVFAVQAVRYLWPDLQGSFRGPLLRSSLSYAVGILPSHFIGTIAPLFTRTWLAKVQSLDALGLYGTAGRFTQPLSILAFAFQNAYIPVYFSVRKEGTPRSLERLAETARNVWALVVFVTLGTATLGPPVIVLMTPERYHAAAGLLPILALSFLGQGVYTLLGQEIFYSKKTYLVPIIALASAVLNVLVTVATATTLGAAGVAWAMVAGSVAQAALAVAFSCRLVRIPHHWGSLVRIVACGLAAAAWKWVPAVSLAEQCVWGALSVLTLPVLLWLTGDPSIRAGWAVVRSRWGSAGAV